MMRASKQMLIIKLMKLYRTFLLVTDISVNATIFPYHPLMVSENFYIQVNLVFP